MSSENGPLCFLVYIKDLIDPEKNPGLVLSAKAILENPKIPKRFLS